MAVNVVTRVVAALATVLAVGSVVQIVRIGESDSKAVWQGNVSSQPHAVTGNS
jgi:hypothetical protein